MSEAGTSGRRQPAHCARWKGFLTLRSSPALRRSPLITGRGPRIGFTLIETMAVIFIIVLAVGLGMPSFLRVYRGEILRSETSTLRSTIQHARYQAIVRQHAMMLNLDFSQQAYWIEMPDTVETNLVQQVLNLSTNALAFTDGTLPDIGSTANDLSTNAVILARSRLTTPEEFGEILVKTRPDGSSVYLRLSTRTIEQETRTDESWRDDALAGGYWLRRPAPGSTAAIVFSGVVAPEALAAWDQLADDFPGIGLMNVTSCDLLHRGWSARQAARWTGKDRSPCQIERLLEPLADNARLVTVLDGSPAALSWIGGVRGQRVAALGTDRFGQTGDLPDLYRTYRLDTDAILDAMAELFI